MINRIKYLFQINENCTSSAVIEYILCENIQGILTRAVWRAVTVLLFNELGLPNGDNFYKKNTPGPK